MYQILHLLVHEANTNGYKRSEIRYAFQLNVFMGFLNVWTSGSLILVSYLALCWFVLSNFIVVGVLILLYLIMLHQKINEWMSENLATSVNDNNWTVSYTCYKGQISFLNKLKLGISTTSVQVLFCFVFYLALQPGFFLFFPSVYSFILFSWFRWFCSCIGFYLFSG